MTDDIVTRLHRHRCVTGIRTVIDDAADEIERLRRNTGCARNQGTTQFCHEALDAQREVETLRAELVRKTDEFRETLTAYRRTIECLTAERDEARREVCAFSFDDPRRTAEDRGWVGLLEPEDHAP